MIGKDTNFDTVLVFNLFDSMLGTRLLESVTFELFARSSGSISVENLNPSATVIMATLSTDIILSNSLNPILIETNPSITRSETLAGYDGTTDFDGPSGTEFLNLMTNDFGSMILTDIESLALSESCRPALRAKNDGSDRSQKSNKHITQA